MKMMSSLVAALRGKNRPGSHNPGFSLRSQYPPYVLYDSDGDEVECNLSTMKMSYGSGSKTVLTEMGPGTRRTFWSNRTAMEKHLILLITTLFAVTVGLVLAAAVLSYNRQITFVFIAQENSTSDETSTPAHLRTTGPPLSTDSLITTTANSSENDNKVSNGSVYSGVVSIGDDSSYKSDLGGSEQVQDTQNSIYLAEPDLVEPDVCETTSCEAAGKLIKSSMNESVDPCDDFYEFACGGWMATHEIPKDKSRFGSFDDVDEKLKASIKAELSRASVSTDSKSVVFAADLYKACIDEATIEKRGVEPLQNAIKSMGGWPLTGKFYNDNEYDWEDSLSTQISELGVTSIYAVSVQPDANDTLVNRVYYDSAGFGLGRNQLVNRTAYPDIVNAYKKYILEAALQLGAKNDSQTRQQIEDLLNFESQLANLSLPQEKKRDSSVWYNRMSFEKFNQLTANRVDWVNLTNRIYSKLNSDIGVKSDELVIVQDIQYVKSVSQLLTKTPKKVIANYLGWMSVMSLSSYTTKEFRRIAFEFNRVVSGVEKEAELWRSCVSRLSDSLSYAVSRLYVDKNFSQKDKEEASLMINDIKESYNELIKESDWLDDITRNKSFIKLNAIKQNIGYPDWMLSNSELDNYYKLTQKVDPKKSFEAILYLQYNTVFREFKSIREAVNLTLSWPMPPAIVNAAYEPTQNSITIPAGILKVPFFDSQRPSYLNYGAIGLVVGHEMTHGFDDEGSQFDPKGDLINWWTEKIHKRFEEKAECFINEYSSIYDPEAKMHLNGNNTVGENIADNGGIREAFRAYQLWVKRHGKAQRLPHVTKYSPEQLFFLSHANVWCNLMRPEALKTQIQYNPHSPAKYRVNVPVSNFKFFSDAYKCGPNSKMNRKDKCVLW